MKISLSLSLSLCVYVCACMCVCVCAITVGLLNLCLGHLSKGYNCQNHKYELDSNRKPGGLLGSALWMPCVCVYVSVCMCVRVCVCDKINNLRLGVIDSIVGPGKAWNEKTNYH